MDKKILLVLLVVALAVGEAKGYDNYINIVFDDSVEKVDIHVFEMSPYYSEKYYAGAIYDSNIYTIKALDGSGNTLSVISGYPFVNNIMPFDETIKSIEIFDDDTLLFSKDIITCDYDGVCEPCESYGCELYENSLTCSDCMESSDDGLCQIMADGMCDPDCTYEGSSNCIEDEYSFESCSDFSLSECKEDEVCESGEIYIKEISKTCCEKCGTPITKDPVDVKSCLVSGGSICEDKEACTGDVIRSSDQGKCCLGTCIQLTDQEEAPDEKESISIENMLLWIGAFMIVVSVILFLIKKKKLIIVSGFIVFLAFSSVFFIGDEKQGQQITGMAASEDLCDYSINFDVLNHPYFDNLKAGWTYDSMITKLEYADPNYLSIIENVRQNYKKSSIYEEGIDVPLPVILGVIYTEHGGGSPITHPSSGELCNYLGYCGMMQVNRASCDRDPGCDWTEFSQGEVDDQVSPGIRELSMVAGYLVNKLGMDKDHPDLWYFAAVGYNGGIGRLVCGDAICNGVGEGTVIGNTMEMYGYDNINKVRWKDVLDSLKFDGNDLVDGGVFGPDSLSGAREMSSHAMRTMWAASKFLEDRGCDYVNPGIGEGLDDIDDEISDSDAALISASKGMGYYSFFPSVSQYYDYDIMKIQEDLSFASYDLIWETFDCITEEHECIAEIEDFTCNDDFGGILKCGYEGEVLGCYDSGIISYHTCKMIPEDFTCRNEDGEYQSCTYDGELLYCMIPGKTYRNCAQEVLDSHGKDNWNIDYCPSNEIESECYGKGKVWDGVSCIKKPDGYDIDQTLKFCIDTGIDVYASDIEDEIYAKRPLDIKFALSMNTKGAKNLGSEIYEEQTGQPDTGEDSQDGGDYGDIPANPGTVYEGSYWDIYQSVKNDMGGTLNLYTDCTDDVSAWCWVHSGCNGYGIYCKHDVLSTQSAATLNTLFRHEIMHNVQAGTCGGPINGYIGVGYRSEWGAEYYSGSRYYCFKVGGNWVNAGQLASMMLEKCSSEELLRMAYCSGAYPELEKCFVASDIADDINWRYSNGVALC